MNIDILEVSKTKWTGMDKFNLDNNYIYYCGQESLGRNGVALIVNKSPKCSPWVQSQKWQSDLSSFPRQTIQHHSNPSLCSNHWCQRSWSWPILWRSSRPSRTNTKKDVLFIIADWNAKVDNQEIPGVTDKFDPGVQNEAEQRITEFCQENSLVTATPSSNNTRDYSTHGHHQMVNTEIRLITFFATEDEETLYNQQNNFGSWLCFRSWTPY